MASCINKKVYSKSDYDAYAFLLELGLDPDTALSEFTEQLDSSYGEDSPIKKAVLYAISNGTYDSDWDYLPASLPMSEEIPIDMNGAKTALETPDEIEDFYRNSPNSTTRRDSMTKRFFEDVVSLTVFNKSTGKYFNPTTTSINDALYEYKKRLLRNLWNFTGIDHEAELNEEDFTMVVSRTFQEYLQKQNENGFDSVYDDYVILKRFNKLIRDFTPFIKVDAAFAKTDEHAKNMYVYDPSGAYRQNWTDKEDVSIENVTSPLVKLLADYFTTYSVDGKTDLGARIGFKRYSALMATVFRWIHENEGKASVRALKADIRKNGIKADFEKIIDTYIREANPSENEKQILSGIKKHVFNKMSNIPLMIRNAFANQAFIQAKYAYIAYRQNWEAGNGIVGQYLEDSFIDTRSRSLHRVMQNKIWLYQQHNDLFNDLLTKHGITVSADNGVISIAFDSSWGTPFNAQITQRNETGESGVRIKYFNYDPSKVNINKTKALISDLLDRLITDDYEDILHGVASGLNIDVNLFDTFADPLCIILGAIKEGTNNNYVFDYDENGFVKTYQYKDKFAPAIQYAAIADGINELNVLTNGEGNKLPVYQLAPAIFDIFDRIDDLTDVSGTHDLLKLQSIVDDKISNLKNTKDVQNVLSENSFLKRKSLLKRIVARSDTKVGNVVKSSDKLTVSELAQVALVDFYQNLHAEKGDLAECIVLQPITYSDKKTQFLPVINTAIDYIGGKKVSEILRSISNINDRNRSQNITRLVSEVKRLRGDKTKKQIYNQFLRFYEAVSKSEFSNILLDGVSVQYDRSGNLVSLEKFDAKTGFLAVAKILENINAYSDNPIQTIRELFKNSDTALNEDFDFLVVNGKLQANETLAFNMHTYCVKDNINLDAYIKSQMLRLATDLTDSDVFLDLYTHPELRGYFETFGKDTARLWIDPYSQTMKNFIVLKGEKEIYLTAAQIQDGALLNDPEITIQLNPIIEGLFYANMLYSPQFDDIMFGGTEGYVPKAKTRITDFSELDSNLFGQITASRLSNEFKRTTFGGSTKRKYAQGLKTGVSRKARFAIVEDDEPGISTLRGDTSTQVAQDGSGWVNGIMARMIQKSLIDSPVGDVRKTIAGWNDPRFGTQIHFKWAETTITTDLRQKSQGDGSAEVMYRKSMEAIDISKKFAEANINMKMFYNVLDQNPDTYSIEDENLTTTKPIFRYDLDTGTYYKLMFIEKVGDKLIAQWRECDNKGKLVPGKPAGEPTVTQVKTLYDIDQALGGAFTYELDEDGDMQISESVHDILYHMVCTHDFKEDFIGYIVNHSAAKAGAINVNDYNSLNNDSTQLRHHYIDTSGFGVQMDADHDLNFADVTEMSQMISLLTQGGNNTELVNTAYADIGRVAAKAMSQMLAAVDTAAIENGNADKIYTIIGKALLDTFDSATKAELGLAQSFIRTAQNAILNETGLDNVILPYSSESIKGSFVTAVISLINKTGIKRKYAGFGGVQVPADKTMQHYHLTVNGQRIAHDYRAMRDAIRGTLQQNGITFEQALNQQIINGRLNPFLEPVTNRKSIQFEDTIMYRERGSVGEGTVIKLNTFKEYDIARNLLDPAKYEIYRWSIKPRELAQGDLWIQTSNGNISEYDLDTVRASFYLSELISFRAGKSTDWLFNTDRKKAVILAAIKQSDLPNGIDINNIFNESSDLLKQCKKMLITKTQGTLNEINGFVKSGISGVIGIQMSQINDDLQLRFMPDDKGNLVQKTTVVSPNIINITSQVVIGRRNFEKFGIKRGDKLSDIKRQGARFFFKRLKQQQHLAKLPTVPGGRYDGVLHLGNNDNVMVLVGEQDFNFDLYGPNQEFRISSDTVSYKGKVLFDNELLENYTVRDLKYMSYVDDKGKTIPVIWVPDWDTFDVISSTDVVKTSSYNYNVFNIEDLLKHTQPESFDENGKQIAPVTIGDNTYLIPQIIDIIEGNSTLQNNNLGIADKINIIETLNSDKNTVADAVLWKKANLLYRNFMHQLQMIQTRIPSQAMQSTMNIEVIDFADTDTNYIWVPKKIFKLQGSDLDIDKAYCMAYDVDENGNIASMSDLMGFTEATVSEDGKRIYLPAFTVDEVLRLERPNKKQCITKPEDGAEIVNFVNRFRELRSLGVRRSLILNEFLKEIASKNSNKVQVILDGLDAQEFNAMQDLIKFANIHNKSKRTKEQAEAALRNQVLASARQIMNMPSSQEDAETPIDMEEPREASKLNISLGSKEKFMTLDNFMSIFIMQKQNMSGKNVIAMTATGIKSYFIVTTYYNTLAKQLEQRLQDYVKANPFVEKPAIADDIVAILNEISFDGKFGNDPNNPVLRTFANINFYEIKKAIAANRGQLSEITFSKDYKENQYNTAFARYANNDTKTLNLEAIVDHLDRMANGNTWQLDTNGNWEYFKVNAPDSLSALLSAATDNAKELILEKLNATVEFADIYTTLLSQGIQFRNIAQVLTDKSFSIVARYAQKDIFDTRTHSFSVKNALNFVLNEGTLPYLQKGAFEAFITDSNKGGLLDNLCNIDSSVFLDSSAVSINFAEYILDRFLTENKLSREQLQSILRTERLIGTTDDSPTAKTLLANITKLSNAREYNKLKRALSTTIMNLFNDTEHYIISENKENRSVADIMISNLKANLRSKIENYKQETSLIGTVDDIDLSNTDVFDPSDLLDITDPDSYAEALATMSSVDDTWFNGTFKKEDLVNIYRYAIKYFIPKNELWNSIPPEQRADAIANLKSIRDDVLYAAQEMKILGNEASINQGMKTTSYDEYSRAKSLETFVNSAYINRGKGEIQEEFVLTKFLNDKEYRDRHIQYYDSVKATVNVLKAIQVTGNFKEMFDYIGVTRHILEKSVAIRLERSFADTILRSFQQDDKDSGINWSTTKKIGRQDFKTISQYCRDLIVLNYFANYGKYMQFKVPIGETYYNDENGQPNIAKKELTKSLNNIHDIATFKHLMDHYIIPKLQTDPRFATNRFIKGLTLDTMKDEKSGKPMVMYKLQDNISDSRNPVAKDKYDGILEDFNKLLYMPIDGEGQNYGIGNWTIGNLFFIYNLLVDKERISGNTLTKLFNDLVSSNNRLSLPYSYYKYLNDLDKGRIKIFDDDGNLIPYEGKQSPFAYNIQDLQYRLSGSASHDNYGVSQTKRRRIVTDVNIKSGPDDKRGQDYPVETDINKLSDYTFGMPFITGISITPQITHIGNFSKKETVTASSESVFNAVTQELTETYGRGEINVKIFGDNDIENEFKDRSDEEKQNMMSSDGFILNGTIYINGSKHSLEAPFHEMMHLAASIMKFSPDQNVRKTYYEWLDAIGQWVDGNIRGFEDGESNTTVMNEQEITGLLGEDLKNRLLGLEQTKYGNRYLSDIKEEILVTLLGKLFSGNFNAVWGSKNLTPDFIQNAVKLTLSKIFKDPTLTTLGINIANAPLLDIMKRFASHLLITDSNLLQLTVNKNQELADLKDFLIKNRFIELSEECL